MALRSPNFLWSQAWCSKSQVGQRCDLQRCQVQAQGCHNPAHLSWYSSSQDQSVRVAAISCREKRRIVRFLWSLLECRAHLAINLGCWIESGMAQDICLQVCKWTRVRQQGPSYSKLFYLLLRLGLCSFHGRKMQPLCCQWEFCRKPLQMARSHQI